MTSRYPVTIYNDLSETLRVFVYSKRQGELAGTDGVESFRKAVVLYRTGGAEQGGAAIQNEHKALRESLG